MLTDMKQTGVPNRTPFSAAQGGTQGGRPRVQMTKPVQTGNAGLTRPVMSNQDAAASRVGAVPSAPQQNPLIQNLPLSAAKPFDSASQTTGAGASPIQPSPLQPAPQSMVPESLRGYRAEAVNPDYYWLKMSSAKNGPTPYSTGPSGGNWWDNEPGATMPQQVDFNAAPSAPSYASGQSPADIVRSSIRQMKNSEIAQLLMEISNGKIRGLSE